MMRRRILYISLYFFFFTVSQSLAQGVEPLPQLERSYLNHFYAEEDSYSKKCFVEIFFDQQGRLYLIPCGVEILVNSIGLFRFDGYSFQPLEIFTPEGNVLEIPWVRAIDQSGRILGEGENKSLFWTDPDQQEQNRIGPANTVYNGLEVMGLDAHSDTIFILGRLKNDDLVLFKEESGKLVEVTSLDLLESEALPFDYAVYTHPESIWLADYALPIFRFDRQKKTLQAFGLEDFIGEKLEPKGRKTSNSRFLPKLVSGPKGITYLYFSAYYGNYLFQLDEEEEKFRTMKDQFPKDWLPRGIFKDQSANICFLFQDARGAYQAILETPSGKRFDYSSVVAGQSNIKMLIAQDFFHQTYFVTSNGLYLAGVREQDVIKQAMTDFWVSSMAELPDGRFLVNTVRNGWFVYDESSGTVEPFQGPDCASNPPAFGIGMKQQIIPDQEGRLWFITQDYLVRYNPTNNECESFDFKKRGTLFAFAKEGVAIYQNDRKKIVYMDVQSEQRVDLGPGVQEDLGGFLRDIHVDTKGIIWIPTNIGLWRIDIAKGKSELLGMEYGFSDMRFTSIYEDEAGKLWLGTYLGGLNIYDPESGAVSIIDQGLGLSNNSVMSIIADEEGDMWVATEYGINLVSKEGEVLNSIYKEDGLTSETFERFDPFRSMNGKLYFGTRNGLSIIDPIAFKASIKKDTSLQVYLTELTYYDREKGEDIIQRRNFDDLATLDISPERPYIRLKFGLSSYMETQNNKYAYLLEGKDEDWHYLGTQPELNISRLPPGNYKLLIKGADFRNNWTSTPIAINIQAREFFYKQPWFYFLLALPFLAFGLIWARNKQRESIRLEEEVAQRTQKIRKDKALIEQQAADLRQLDQMKSRFFTNISHELRTPITLIKTPLENLFEKYSTSLNEQVGRSLKMVLSNAGKLGRLVEELLELSSLEAKKATLKETSTPIRIFCRQLFGAYESGAALKNIAYHFNSQIEKEAHYLVDRKRLEKVVNNLLSNALKFTPRGGQIQMSLTREAEQLRIEVKDSGRGIPEEDLPNLFDRYFQTRRTDIATEGGTGIGLALSKELANLMHGDLLVESEWGKGACFILQFPAKACMPPKEIPAMDPILVEEEMEHQTEEVLPMISTAKDKSKTKILIVEDNRDMQELICNLLIDQYECTVANNGAEAWALLQEENQAIKDIELILSDVMMPEMDGYALLEKIKSHPYWQQLPVVMLTARSAEEDKLHALRMGVDDYLLKPFSPKELDARLHNLIANYQVRKSMAVAVKASSGTVDIAFELEESAHSVWLKEVEDAAREALEKGLKLTTAFLAERVFLSERQFSRKVKMVTGLTPNAYIQEVKLQKARHLLENQVYTTINEVAQATGYSSGSYLTKVFLEHFGKKPIDYL